MRPLAFWRFAPILVLTAALTVCAGASSFAQGLPQLVSKEKAKPQKPEVSSLPTLLANDAGIDREIERIQALLEQRRAESSVTGPALSATGGVSDPGEKSRRERLASELVIDLERQIDLLNELKEILRDNASYELERQSWKGFPSPPPYPISFIDDIRDSLIAQVIALHSYELRLSLARASFKRLDEALEKSRVTLRRAEEELSQNAGTPGEEKRRRFLDLARLQNERNETGLMLAEIQRIAYETAIEGKQSKIDFLEDKLRTAEASSPLSKEDLEKKLAEVEALRRNIEKELLAAQEIEAEGRKKLEEIRTELTRLRAAGGGKEPEQGPFQRLARKLSRNDRKESAHEEQIGLLPLEMEAQQAVVETARFKILALKARMRFVNAGEKAWNDRFWLNEPRDLKDVRVKLEEVAETLLRLDGVKKWADSSLTSWMGLIINQKERLAGLAPSSPMARIQSRILETYEDRQHSTLRLIEGIGRLERLVNRLKDELDRRIRDSSSSDRMKESRQNAYRLLKRIWNTELYVATEETIVEDRSIVKPVSVTIGKVLKALILLVIGTWIAGRIAKFIPWILTRRLQWTKQSAEPVGKVVFGVMFVCVFVISLVSVNIPLAVFTFLGGALAIGIGFGAQNIINNFISGLILIFDRSIRVGDIVEVDGQGGRVTEIGMRISHIHRFDGIDMLVPNSQFLQQKVINWTLSDRQIRYEISVGVAYGTPTREAERILLQAIDSHPMVLKAPPPTILFEEFGDSSLVFKGYFWMELISNRDNRIAVSEIRHAIGESLGKAGITISFPQRDVHLDSVKPIEVRVVPTEKSG